MNPTVLLLLSMILATTGLAEATPVDCGPAELPCVLEDGRSYHTRVPDGWDGVSPLPVMLYFHGWKRQGTQPVRSERVGDATRRRGVLLVAPNGANRTWNFWSSETPDVSFAKAVLEDVARHYPVDRDQIFVSGYSFGSAMAWRYACDRGNELAALIAVAGSLRQIVRCPQAPRQVRHVHGLKDTVMDFPMGPGGDTTHPVAHWRQIYACGDAERSGAWHATQDLNFERISWENCATGAVYLDLHPRGHFIPKGWIARQLDELLGRPPTFP